MPYLLFEGTAAEAIVFYCEGFGATELPGKLTDPPGRILDAGRGLGYPCRGRGTLAHCEESPDTWRRSCERMWKK